MSTPEIKATLATITIEIKATCCLNNYIIRYNDQPLFTQFPVTFDYENEIEIV